MVPKHRLEKLETAIGPVQQPASIVYIEGEKTEAEAMAEWETENGPLSECGVVLVTVYEASAMALSAGRRKLAPS